MTFNKMIEELKEDNFYCREEWDDGKFLVYVKGTKDIKPYKGSPYGLVCDFLDKEKISIESHIDMFDGEDRMICGYNFTDEDLSATDWKIKKK